MSAALIFAKLMQRPSIQKVIGDRYALSQLDPDVKTFPALVYQVISDVRDPYLAGSTEKHLHTARIQVNPIAKSIGEVDLVHRTLREQLDWLVGDNVANHRIIRMNCESPISYNQDNDTGVWTAPADYFIIYED